MELDSVRELKAVLTSEVVSNQARRAAQRRLTFAAGPLSQAKGLQPSIALGVAKAGRHDFKLAVRVQRRELDTNRQLDTIRSQARGEVDERFIGPVLKLDSGQPAKKPWHQTRCRPLRIGSSLGHFDVTAGTLGCFVQARRGQQVLILSNNHVLANENRAEIGGAILQPGAYDGGKRPGDVIGKLVNFVKLKVAGVNYVDCAVCSIKNSIEYDATTLFELGQLGGLGDAMIDVGAAVAKVGRTTGLTRGRVTAFELDNVVVDFGIGVLRFDGQIEIEGDADEPFSARGDSGSLIVNEELRGVALLFAGSEFGGTNNLGLTFGNPLRTVLDALKVDLVI